MIGSLSLHLMQHCYLCLPLLVTSIPNLDEHLEKPNTIVSTIVNYICKYHNFSLIVTTYSVYQYSTNLAIKLSNFCNGMNWSNSHSDHELLLALRALVVDFNIIAHPRLVMIINEVNDPETIITMIRYDSILRV